MVKIAKEPRCTRENGMITPQMIIHELKCKDGVAEFKKGKSYRCYITLYSDGRYAVFTTSGSHSSGYHVFSDKKDVERCFDEA